MDARGALTLNIRTMSALAEPMGPVIIRPRTRGIRSFLIDTLLLTRRNLLLTIRTPELVVFAAIVPIMFVLLFRYVFGGSIKVPGYTSYVDYLMPGIIVQTALFGGSSSAVAVAEDFAKGITDRFRSLPTNRAAILAARTFADLVRLTYTMGLMVAIGLLVGFRFHNSVLPILAGFGIALLFGYACSWLFTLVGLTVRNAESATLVGFLLTFPLVFAASTFTSTRLMPGGLRAFADNQPVTQVANALRALTHGSGVTWSVAFHAVAWSAGILIVAASLATWKFRKT
jgi:ABC transporter DrrB family efflux protein